MKYLKKINELFDDEEMRSKFSHEYLSGDLGPDDVNQWDKYEINPVYQKLKDSVNYLSQLDFRKIGNILEFSFTQEDDGFLCIFTIEVTIFSNKFLLKSISNTIIDDQEDWNKLYIKSLNSIEEVISHLNNQVRKIIYDFSNYLVQYDIELFNDDTRSHLN